MNKTALALKAEYATVSQVVLRYGSDLDAHGMALTRMELDAPPGDTASLVFHFVNKVAMLSMDITFWPARNGLKGGFIVLICDRNDRRLNLKKFLNKHGKSDLADRLAYDDPKIDIRAFAESFMEMLLESMRTDLRDIMEGKTFEETPFEWGNYK